LSSKDPAQLEVPLAMAGVADAGSNYERTERGLGEDAAGEVAGEGCLQGESIHFGGFDAGDGVDFFTEERWQGEEVMEISGAEKVVLIAVEFVGAVSAEAKWAA